MTEREPVVRVTLKEVYQLLLETSAATKEIQQRMTSGNYDARITALEEAKWKATGAAGIIGGLASLLMTKFHWK